MDNIFIKIAHDLKIEKFDNESDVEYMQRLTYSAISCWIKAISLDRFIGQNDVYEGISKKHLTEKAILVLKEYINNFSDLKDWFIADKEINDAVKLLENRLFQSGDLLYIGFGTNVILSKPYEKIINKNVVQVIGKVHDENAGYSGITLLKKCDCFDVDDNVRKHLKEFKDFISSCKWTQGEISPYDKEYFNPLIKTSAISKCWQGEKSNFVNGIRLVRLKNNLHYEYLLERQMNDVCYHSTIDPFLIEQREHIRIMVAIKAESGYCVKAKAIEFKDYIRLYLYTLLPKQESKWLEILSWPCKNIFDIFEWKIKKSEWPIIKNVITNVGINIQGVKNNG